MYKWLVGLNPFIHFKLIIELFCSQRMWILVLQKANIPNTIYDISAFPPALGPGWTLRITRDGVCISGGMFPAWITSDLEEQWWATRRLADRDNWIARGNLAAHTAYMGFCLKTTLADVTAYAERWIENARPNSTVHLLCD